MKTSFIAIAKAAEDALRTRRATELIQLSSSWPRVVVIEPGHGDKA
jgi:hypothetical protein